LTIGASNDKYEQEADRVADQVMRMPEPAIQRSAGCSSCGELDEEQIQTKPIGDQITPLVQRQEEPEEEEEPAQLKVLSGRSPPVGGSLHNQIKSLKGGGQPLPESSRTFFESRFGRGFNDVRVHTDAKAAKQAKSVSAQAFTTGKDIVFGDGQYSPQTRQGKHLLAHELVHTIQQTGSGKKEPVPNIQRTIVNGYDNHDDPGLHSELFRGAPVLEAVMAGEYLIRRGGYLGRGEPVRKIQLALMQQAPNALPIYGADGIFGAETEKAVKNFQRDSGLPFQQVDGIVGPVTLGLMDDKLPVSSTSSSREGCECDYQYSEKAARLYGANHVVVPWFGIPDPKTIKVVSRTCQSVGSKKPPCSWGCVVKCDYFNYKFDVYVQLMNSQRIVAYTPPDTPDNYPVCIYDFECPPSPSFGIKLTEVSCFHM